MFLTETSIEGTLNPDGTLELDEKPNLPAGRVRVTLRQESEMPAPADDSFWQRMQAMWAIPSSVSAAPDGGATSLAELRLMRDEWELHQQAIERLQEEASISRQTPEETV